MKFGPDYACRLKRKAAGWHDIWHLDEVVISINGEKRYLWRAVDQEGYVLDEIVQVHRNTKAARRLLTRLLWKQGRPPKRIITDKLGSYGAARRKVMPKVEHRQHKGLNNRAEKFPCSYPKAGADDAGISIVAGVAAVRLNLLKVVPAALHNEIGLLPWSPLAGGFLSGKYTRDSVLNADGTRYGDGNVIFQHMGKNFAGAERNWATIDVVRQIAEKIGATASQVALSWVTNRPAVSATIIGARTMKQLNDNLAAVELPLVPEAISHLDTVSAPTPDEYPYGRFGSLQHDRYIDSSEQALREL